MVSPPDKSYPRRLQTPVMKDNRTSRFIKSAILAAGLALANFSHAADPHYWQWAQTPPMGWNSWDSFGAGVWQADVLANADYMDKNLKAHGWNIITIDIQWYEPLAHTTSYRKGAILETDAMVLNRDRFMGHLFDFTINLRLYDRVERRAGEWRILRMDAIYDKDRLDPVIPGSVPPDFFAGVRFDGPDAAIGFAKWRIEKRGGQVPVDLPIGGTDSEKQLRTEAGAWLEAGPTG